MKATISKIFDVQKIADQVRGISEDLVSFIMGGISIADNLPMEYITVNVTNGREVTLTSRKLRRIVGAQIVDTGGAAVSATTLKRNANGSMNATITCTPSTATVTFLVYGD